MISQQSTNQHLHQTPFAILHNVPLNDKNYFRTGGNAQFYCRPNNATEFAAAIVFAQEKNIDIFVLGTGANILISDEGFQGLVIHPALRTITVLESSNQDQDNATIFVQAGAGCTIDQLINYCFDHGIIGLEEFSGIPSSVGGAVYINLHYYEFLLEQFLVSATLIHRTTGAIITVDTAWFQFGYDQSKLQEKEYFVIDATFQLTKADTLTIAQAQGRYQEIIRHRRRRFPYEYTCGSFFRNFHPHEVQNTDKKLIYVAYYLDKLGIKGELSVGGATVSHQHANMIVSNTTATSQDIIDLTVMMQAMVDQSYGIRPQPECQLIGFGCNPFAV